MLSSKWFRPVGLSLAILALAGSCAFDRKVYAPSPLLEQILRPTPATPGNLSNQNCEAYKGKVCTKWSVRLYDLKATPVRAHLNKLDFICSLAGRRFVICMDKPGFCRRIFRQKCFLGICGERKLIEEEFVALEPWQAVLDFHVTCFNKDRYDFGELLMADLGDFLEIYTKHIDKRLDAIEERLHEMGQDIKTNSEFRITLMAQVRTTTLFVSLLCGLTTLVVGSAIQIFAGKG